MLSEPDDRVDRSRGRDALATAREGPELGVGLRGDLGEEGELLGALRRALRQRLHADLLLQHDDVLHQHRVQRPGVEEQHVALERCRAASLQALAPAEVDVVGGRYRGGLEREPQRLAPLLELVVEVFEVPDRRVARVHELQHEHAQVGVLDRRRAARGVERHELPLEMLRQGKREQRVQLRPLRGNPLLVAVETDLGVEPEVHDLAQHELGLHLLPPRRRVQSPPRDRTPGRRAGRPASGRTAPTRSGSRSSSCGSRARRTARSASPAARRSGCRARTPPRVARACGARRARRCARARRGAPRAGRADRSGGTRRAIARRISRLRGVPCRPCRS